MATIWNIEYANGESSSTAGKTFPNDNAGNKTVAAWLQCFGAGTVVAVCEGGQVFTRHASGGEIYKGSFTALTSTTCQYVVMGNGAAPPPVVTGSQSATASAAGAVALSVAPAVASNPIAVGTNDGRLDYTPGTALTDTATTTVQRAAIKTSFLLAGTMSQGETVTLGTTNAVDGDYIKIIRTSTSAQTCTVVNGGAGAGTLHVQLASKVNFTEARFNGTNWLLSACGPS